MVCYKLFLLIFVKTCALSATCGNSLEYVFPEPLIEVFHPRGLRVSIPDFPGIKLFAFHGNINVPIRNKEFGQLQNDILHKENDRWVFSNSSVKLNKGDKIYYWMFVVKDNLRYLSSNHIFEVEDITSESVVKIENDHNNNSHAMNESEREHTSIHKSKDESCVCEKIILNLTNTLYNFQREIDSLKETNVILRDLVEGQPNISTTLWLDGQLPLKDDPLLIVQNVLRQKLNLLFNIDSAERVNANRITFETSSLDNKITIIQTAKGKLAGSRMKITY